VDIVNQNIITDHMEGDFDLVIMSLVLCLIRREDVIQLLKKVNAILRPGGTLVLGEILLNESKTGPLSAAFFAVHMLVNGSGGDLFSLKEICELLNDCGIRYERNFPTALQRIIVGKNERP
jgi:SAM-dependent methyltransferase